MTSNTSMLSCTDTDTCIGIGPIPIRGYVIFPKKNPIREYVSIIYIFF
uniref:Uncharacterized protein n=1 Tax=Arundo donax TaxID=35708 RepID=A0A0A9FJK7_ARUDO